MPVIPCAVAVALRLRTLLAPPRCRHETEVCVEARGEQRVCEAAGPPSPTLTPPPGQQGLC